MPTLVTLLDNTIPVAADFMFNYNALNGVCGTSTSISSYTTGDTLYASAANTLSKLAIGLTGQTNRIVAGVPSWASQGGYLFGLVMTNGTDATNDIDIAVGECASDDTTAATRTVLSVAAMTKQLDAVWAAGSAAGGRLSTDALADGTWHVFAFRPASGSDDIFYALSATASPPTGSKKRRIGSIIRAAGSILPFYQRDDRFLLKTPVLDINVSQTTTAATRTLASVPTGVRMTALLNVTLDNGSVAVYLSSLDITDVAASLTLAPLGTINNAAAGTAAGAQAQVDTNTSAQIRCVTTAGGGATIRVATLGWIDCRGRYA